MNSIKKLVSWLGGLVLIILFGLVLITLYNAYYCFGPMIFGEHLASASRQFWSAELLLRLRGVHKKPSQKLSLVRGVHS